MEGVKKLLSSIPFTAWVIIGVVLLILFWWVMDDIGIWNEHRKQNQFDAKQVEYEQQIDALKKNENELIRRAEEAEAKEQAKSVESDLLRQEAEKRGINIGEAQKVIDAATSKYQQDQEFMDKVKAGEISKLQLCQKQCADSAEEGFPCRPTYCSPFKE